MTASPCCAHMRVEYRTEDFPLSESDAASILATWKDDGMHAPPRAGVTMTRGWWECASGCGKRFEPVSGSPRTATPEPAESASAALYGFAGWLTSQPELVQFCDRSDAALAADLVALFCKSQGYADVPNGWAAALKPYPKVPPRTATETQPAELPDRIREIAGAAIMPGVSRGATNKALRELADTIEAASRGSAPADEIRESIRYVQTKLRGEEVVDVDLLEPAVREEVLAILDLREALWGTSETPTHEPEMSNVEILTVPFGTTVTVRNNAQQCRRIEIVGVNSDGSIDIRDVPPTPPEPIAWAVIGPAGGMVELARTKDYAQMCCPSNGYVAPLFLHPPVADADYTKAMNLLSTVRDALFCYVPEVAEVTVAEIDEFLTVARQSRPPVDTTAPTTQLESDKNAILSDAWYPEAGVPLDAFFACLTGDCPHQTTQECVEGLGKDLVEHARRVQQLERLLASPPAVAETFGETPAHLPLVSPDAPTPPNAEPTPDPTCTRCDGKGTISGSEWLGNGYEQQRCPSCMTWEAIYKRQRDAALSRVAQLETEIKLGEVTDAEYRHAIASLEEVNGWQRSRVAQLEAQLAEANENASGAWECIQMAQEKLAALIFLTKMEKGTAAMFLPEAINNACLLIRDEALAYAENEWRTPPVPTPTPTNE